ncbi:hypothetical protein HDU77_001853 [Chytriomyces hyalinus]|nr:hypothetical protein HDU77_001853 [Chytriomyces hyalinus]
MSSYELTLGIVGTYCTMPNLVFNHSLVTNLTTNYHDAGVDYLGGSGFAFLNSLIAQIAADEVNNDTQLLPDIHVNLKHFSDCGPHFPWSEESFGGNSSGFASSILVHDIANVHKDVVGIVGTEYSSTVRAAGQAWGLYQIPYCAAYAASPRFSDKVKYPYLWRSFAPFSLGAHLFQLLKAWNVRQIAIVFQEDGEMGAQSAVSIRKDLLARGIKIPVYAGLKSSVPLDRVNYIKRLVKASSARYLFISATTGFTAKALYRLYDPEFAATGVYMGMNSPIPASNPLDAFGNDYFEKIKGYIYIQPEVPDMDTPEAKKIYETVERVNGGFAVNPVDFWNYFEMQWTYDCVHMMLRGFDKIRKGYSSEMLVKRELNSYMNYTLFQDLGYNGLTRSPMTLNSNGDLIMPWMVLVFTGDLFNSTPIGHTDSEATEFQYYNKMTAVFPGGSPPSDGLVEVKEYSPDLRSIEGRLMLSIAILGIVSTSGLFMFVILNRNHKAVKAMSVPETLIMLGGFMMEFIALLTYLQPATLVTCHVRLWLNTLGYSIVVSTIVCKHVVVAFLFQETKTKRFIQIQWRFRILNAALIFFPLALLVGHRITSRTQLISIKLMADTCYNYCREKTRTAFSIATTLSYYNVLLTLALIPTIYSLQRVHWSSHQSDTTVSIVLLIWILGGVLSSILQITDTTGHQADAAAIDLKREICVNILSLLALYILMSACVVEVLLKQFKKRRNAFWKRVSQASSRLASFKEDQQHFAVSLKQESRTVLSGVVTEWPLLMGDGAYRHKNLLNTVDTCIYKARLQNDWFWTRWRIARVQLHVLGSKKMWLSFDAQKQYQTFVLSKDTCFEPCRNLLILTQNPSKDAPEMAAGLACCVVLEFNDKEETDDFLAELEACIRELKESVTCPPRRPEIDGRMSVAKRN